MAILAVPEGQLENTVPPENPQDGMGSEPSSLATQPRAPGPDDDLSDTLRGVGDAGRRLREEPLVMVLVTVKYEIHASVG
jgi:hypothetical protein